MDKKAATAIITATIIWGGSVFFYKNLLLFGWSVIAATFLVRFFRFIGMLIITRIKKISITNIDKKDINMLILNGLASFATPVFFLLSMKHTLIATATFLSHLAPVWVAIFGVLFLREKLTKSNILALILAIIGIVLISNNGFNLSGFTNLGLIFGLLTGLSYGVDLMTGRKLKNNSSYLVAFWSNLIPVICFIPLTLFFFYIPKQNFAIGLLFAIFYGLISSTATVLYFYSLRHAIASKVSILAQFEAVGAALIAFFVFNEIPSLLSIIGYALILSACIILIIGKRIKNFTKFFL